MGARCFSLVVSVLAVTLAACPSSRADPAPAPHVSVAAPAASLPEAATPPSAPEPVVVDGPYQVQLEPGRSVYHAFPSGAGGPRRVVGHLHGVCGGPDYACGRWVEAAVEAGVLVCPSGNTRCGAKGPPSWEAASWGELVRVMDHDLESAIAKVEARRPGAIDREGAVLTGYSRGAYAAPVVAKMHPGRWPYLVLIEANVPLTAAGLRAAGVRAVALVAGERGAEIAGERKTAEALAAEGFPAKLFVMKNTGHLYSDDMASVMREALAFVLAPHDAP